MLLKDKTAVITGCNKGLGKSMLETFTSEGANVFACARKRTDEFLDLIQKITEATGSTVTPVYFDLEDTDQVKAAVSLIIQSGKKIDILVNNAGVASGALFQMTSLKDIERLLKINYTSQLLFTQGITRNMIKNKSGSIINISSVSGILGNPGTLSYGTSKAAMNFATKTLAAELGQYNIRVNAIAPSVTNTYMFNQMDEKARNKMIESSALKRPGEPREIANAALFLASELSSFITGQIIRVDGGINA